ncbi:L,D-transpeptidase [Neobacillus sp.]|jgi:L,D-transpeptidase catalytic domain/Putative peptidoglycan binding domain|uniref:L,D-transpeptidase n=1 Tax=Neobacillus sp. TaxID=2675273 RepID=UPI0035B538AD
MANTLQESKEKIKKQRVKSLKWYKNWKWMGLISLVLLFAAISYYQGTHFNANTKINGINVGGLTAEQALQKLQKSVLKNVVFIGEQKILDGKDTKMNITDKDLPAVKKILQKQRTFFPSTKAKNYSLMSSETDYYRSQTLKKELEEKLVGINKTLKAPQDAQAHWQQGKIVVTKSSNGKQYDIARLLKDYDKQKYTSEIHLNPVYIQPVKEDSEIVKNQKKKLKELLGRTLEYKVQDKVYTFKANKFIKSATVSKDMKIIIKESNIKNKIEEINDVQSTLDKNFTFKTHSGKVISVKGQGYGWALDVEKETALIHEAFEKGKKSLSATNIVGHGWKGEGYGYETLTNNGIGDTYAEVSISEQRIWLYKNGKMVLTTNVVTGRHDTGEDTSKGVWYILYKRSPYVLKGSRAGSSAYEIEVNYWAPFTNSGQGFHDASWRTNWSSNAYLTAGSGGCVNVQPNIMKQVYDNLSVYQPVIVY